MPSICCQNGEVHKIQQSDVVLPGWILLWTQPVTVKNTDDTSHHFFSHAWDLKFTAIHAK